MSSRLFRHLSRYTGASLLLTIAGVVSFPILTRLFSVEEYGLLGYVGLLLALAVGVAKLGIQHAAVRFRSEVEAREGERGVEAYVATVLVGMTVVAIVVAALWALVSQMLPDAVWNHPLLKPLLLFTSVLVAVRTIESALVNLLKADEKSGVLSVYAVVKRFIELAVILSVLFFVSRSLWGFFSAAIVVEVGGLIALLAWYLRIQRVVPGAFSLPLARRMLAFSIPLIGYELASVVLSLGDRYVIQVFLGAQDLGVYTAAYNLSDYLRIVLIASIASAVVPVYLRTLEQQGEAATRALLQRVLHGYLLVAVPVVFGLVFVSEAVLTLVASSKYAAGAVVMPWAVAGMALEGLLPILAAMLYVRKRSGVMLAMVLIAACANLLANWWLVPRFGIVGAAWSTTGAYALLLLLGTWWGRGGVCPTVPWAALARFVAAGAVMAWAVSQVSVSSGVIELVARVGVGCVVYAALVFAIDAPARAMVRDLNLRRGTVA